MLDVIENYYIPDEDGCCHLQQVDEERRLRLLEIEKEEFPECNATKLIRAIDNIRNHYHYILREKQRMYLRDNEEMLSAFIDNLLDKECKKIEEVLIKVAEEIPQSKEDLNYMQWQKKYLRFQTVEEYSGYPFTDADPF